MTKVIVRIKGGLGNQLFCYAAARRLALFNKAELVIDDLTGYARDYQFRRKCALDKFRIMARKATPAERMEPFSRYRRGLVKLAARTQPFYKRNYVEQEGLDFDSRLLDFKVKGSVYLDGYWQSEGYFKDIEDVIRQDLCIAPPQDLINQQTANQILDSNAISVHIRWFKKPDNNSINNKLKGYYAGAVKKIIDSVSHPRFFLFSNYPKESRCLLHIPEDRITCVEHNSVDESAYADLWLMALCKHFIIANSTFSWWGAWLAASKNKLIIAPNQEIPTGEGIWGFKGLVPEDWVLVS